MAAEDATSFPDSDVETGVGVEEVPVAGQPATLEVREADGGTTEIDGELLAIDERAVYLLADGQTVVIPRSELEQASVRVYEAHGGSLVTWTSIGTLSTLSHGYYLALSAPAWIIGGIFAGLAAGEENDAVATNEVLDRLRSLARFPAGLPAGWDPDVRHEAPPEPERRERNRAGRRPGKR